MEILLDTHSFLWFIVGDSRLSAHARALMEDGGNQLYLSIASVWEMAIKISLGKLQLTHPFGEFLPSQLRINDIRLFEIKLDHLIRVSDLPFHHRDPFDRLIISQSLIEGTPVLGNDELFDRYGINRLW